MESSCAISRNTNFPISFIASDARSISRYSPTLAIAWEYGISIDWIGQLIEKVSGQSLRDYLRKNLFDPLGMDDTDFIQTAEQKARRATVHQKHPDGATCSNRRS